MCQKQHLLVCIILLYILMLVMLVHYAVSNRKITKQSGPYYI